MLRVNRTIAIYLGMVLLTGVVTAWAQQSKGSFTGVVTDSSGAVVPGAKVTATEQGTGFAQSNVTSSVGSYILPLLPPGIYVITAVKEGFSQYREGPITLAVDQQAEVNIQIKVGSASTLVQVEGSAPVLDTQSYSVGTTIEQAMVSELPFNGRQFLEAMLFTPGVVPGTQDSELNRYRGGSINVNGMRESMNTFLIDGMNDTSFAVGTYAATPPLDSIQEFRMETGVYDAQFGTNAGAQVNIVTKSGTDAYHGTLYEYLRNSGLDSRNFFEPTVPPFRRNQFGASVGGPVSIPHLYDGRDKTFFFLNYEGLRDLHDFYSRAHVPDAAEQSGDFSELLPGNGCATGHTVLLDPLLLFGASAPLVIPSNNVGLLASYLPSGTLDPVGKGLASLYPAPNLAVGACGGENYTAVVKRKVYTNDVVGRFDHRWGTKDNAFFRINLSTDSELTPSGLPTGLPGYGTTRDDWFPSMGLDWTHTFSPTLLNEAKVDYNRWQYHWGMQDQGNPIAQQLGLKGLLTAPRDIGVPNVSFSGFDSMGAANSVPQAGAVNTFEYADTFTQIHGNHLLAYGLQIRNVKRGNFYEDLYASGDYKFTGDVTGDILYSQLPSSVQEALRAECPAASCSFGNGLADGLIGLPTAWADGAEGYISGAASSDDFFAQDKWKVRPNLTLTFGLRYEYNNPLTDKFNHLAGFDFNTNICGSPGALLVAGTSAAALDCFVGTVDTASGYPSGTFANVGTLNLGSTQSNRSLQRPDRDDWAPRFGLAWQPSQKTVIRAGGGMYYDQMTGELYFQKSFNPPSFGLTSGNLEDNETAVFTALGTPPSEGGLELGSGEFLQNVFTAPSVASSLFPTLNPVIIDLHDSTIYEWSFDVQRELGRSWLIDVAYVGTRGLHLPYEWDPNQGNNSNPALCSGGACPTLFPDYLTMGYTDSSGKSIYHSLQAKLERHFSSGLAIKAAYTYGKSLDTNSTYEDTAAGPNFPENSYDRAAEKGRSDFDYRQRFTLSYIYSLPFGDKVGHLSNPRLNYLIEGWQLAGIAMMQSGAPYTVSVSGNPSGNIDGNDRPNVVPGAPVYPAHQTVNQWALASAFSVPTEYTYGNAGRDTLNGPGLADWDFGVIRDFRLTETKKLEFHAEMFNIFNQPNFTMPDGNISDTTFGVIGNTVQSIAGQASGGPGDPREIQFSLRFVW